MEIPTLRPDVLGRLLVIPSMLEVLPGTGAMAMFLDAALREVPGVRSIVLCAEGSVYPPDRSGFCTGCLSLTAFPVDGHCKPLQCRLVEDVTGEFPWHAILLATSRHSYGYLVLEIDNPDLFALYEPHVRNIANIVTTVIENRAFVRELRSTNSRLTEILDHLEQRVEERTQTLSEEIARREVLEATLRASEEKYRNLLATTSEGFWLVDRDFRTIEVNEYLCKMLGYNPNEILGKTAFDFVDEENKKILIEQQCQMLSTKHRNYEMIFRTKDGNHLDTIVHATTIRNKLGEIEGSFAFISDITDRKQAEEKLRLAASVFTHAREGIFITNANNAIIDVNHAFTQITGYSRDEVLGQNPRLLQSGLHEPEFYEEMWRNLTEKGHWNGEIWNRRKNGEVYAEMLTITVVRDIQGKTQNYVALFSDITVQKAHQQQLEHIAHHDALTNLPNRVLLADRLYQAMAQVRRRGQQLAVVYLDLDGFKTVNDTYGHEVGDQLLMAVASRMKQSLREGDTIARIGGDEFVAVLIDLADTQADKPILNRLLAAAAQPIQVGEHLIQVSASLGVTFYPQTEKTGAEKMGVEKMGVEKMGVEKMDLEQLLRQADQAMYQAKVAGKNRYCIFNGDRQQTVRSDAKDQTPLVS